MIPAFPSAWFARYQHMPVWRGRSSLPKVDGDTRWLDHLADAILADPTGLKALPHDHLWRATVEGLRIDPEYIRATWPDPAGELLRQWKEWG